MNQKTRLLISVAKAFIGIDITPEDKVVDEFACSDQLSKLLHLCFSEFPEGIASTEVLNKELKKSKLFKETKEPKAGCVVVSPRTVAKNGHTGVLITDTMIVSNSSINGRLEQNYTLASWIKIFEKGRGLKTYFYEIK